MKKLSTSILLTLFSATIFTPTHVEASWLSKTWKKIEKSWNEAGQQSESSETIETSTSKIRLPQRSDYPSNYPVGRVIGQHLNIKDRSVAGVFVGSTYEDVHRVLGTPTEEQMFNPSWRKPQNVFARYGGITFYSHVMAVHNTDLIEIVNRDATTYSGIAVGDTLEQVYEVYGRPTHIFDDNVWFYGAFMRDSDYIYGIRFINDGERVTKIIVT
ncbi:hypothetical protein [Veillonella sp. CHU740]|uniref:hypothetical protein n=1 Tax=Veillonella sp. CHU740 TaxID=2490950 RepID=UPI000F8DE6BD|nr:hypothetical protein [Veillonella sp. CHU740]